MEKRRGVYYSHLKLVLFHIFDLGRCPRRQNPRSAEMKKPKYPRPATITLALYRERTLDGRDIIKL